MIHPPFMALRVILPVYNVNDNQKSEGSYGCIISHHKLDDVYISLYTTREVSGMVTNV